MDMIQNTPVCNKCQSKSVVNYINRESFFYCRLCKVEVDVNGRDVNLPIQVDLNVSAGKPINSVDNMTDEEYDKMVRDFSSFI